MVQHYKPALITTHVQLHTCMQLQPDNCHLKSKEKNGSLIKQPAAAFQRRSKVSVVASPAMLRPCGAGTGVGGR